MLNPLRLNYIETGRYALTLSLKLERIAKGEAMPQDFELITKVADELSQLLSGQRPTGRLPLFASPQGLRVAIAVSRSREKTSSTQDPLVPISEMLKKLRLQGKDGALSQELRTHAKELSGFFQDWHDYAQGLVARMPRRTSEGVPRAAVGLLR